MKFKDELDRSLSSARVLKTAVALFLAGLVYRTALCFLFRNEIIPGSDQIQEIMLGRKFASGNFYGVLDAYWAPVYPILIGIASYFTDSPVVPAVLVSILAGSLAVPLTYLIVRQSYGPREALIASVIAIFFPHMVNSVLALGSENVYFLWIIGALIIAWKALTKNSAILYVATGILLGLGYLTRPEAIGYSIYFVFLIFVFDQRYKRSIIKNSLPRAAVLFLSFALLAAPYIIYLKTETGEWTVSGKARINTIAAELDDNLVPNDPPRSTSESAKELLKYFFLNLVEVHKAFPVLLPPLLLLLVGLGLFSVIWDKERLERELYLILVCLITIVGYAAAVVQMRYFLVLLPIFFGWIACGIVHLSVWLNNSARNWRPLPLPFGNHPRLVAALCIAAILLYVLPLNSFMRSTDDAWEGRGYEERDAGLWLRQNGKPGHLVFSASRRPVFYSNGEQLAPTTTDLNQILFEITRRKADYVVTSDRALKRNPFLKDLHQVLCSDPRFGLVYDVTPRKGYRISIFELRSSTPAEVIDASGTPEMRTGC